MPVLCERSPWQSTESVCVCVIKVKDSPWYSTDPFWARIILLPSALVLHNTCNLKEPESIIEHLGCI